MPVFTVKEALAMPEVDLIEAVFNENAEKAHNMLQGALEFKFLMKNQRTAEGNAKLTKELVLQTTLVANQTGNLVAATWGVVIITLITQLALLAVNSKGIVSAFFNLLRAISAY